MQDPAKSLNTIIIQFYWGLKIHLSLNWKSQVRILETETTPRDFWRVKIELNHVKSQHVLRYSATTLGIWSTFFPQTLVSHYSLDCGQSNASPMANGFKWGSTLHFCFTVTSHPWVHHHARSPCKDLLKSQWCSTAVILFSVKKPHFLSIKIVYVYIVLLLCGWNLHAAKWMSSFWHATSLQEYGVLLGLVVDLGGGMVFWLIIIIFQHLHLFSSLA